MKKIKRLMISLNDTGLARILGKKHAKIMEFIWKSNSPITSHILVKKLKYGKLNTASTALNQLWNRGLLKREKIFKPKIHYEYTPKYTKKEFIDNILKILDETKQQLK